MSKETEERCTHCGATSGLIEDDWHVWHCLERSDCLERQLADVWLTGTPYQVAPLGCVEKLRERITELETQLQRAEEISAHFETACAVAVETISGVARRSNLNAVADELEAAWRLSTLASRRTVRS